MPAHHRKTLLLLTFLGLNAILTAPAHATNEQVEARQAEMKTYNQSIRALAAIAKESTPYTAAEVQDILAKIEAATAKAIELKAWDATSNKDITIDTNALPQVWSKPAEFADHYKQFNEARSKLAATTDLASFKAAFPALGQSCKSCHEDFRRAE